jgi:hypothetical protein
MRLIVRPLVVVALASLAAGAVACTEETAQQSNEQIAQQLQGFWADTAQVPGSWFRMFLNPDGAQLTGSGDFGFEAGMLGTLSITGFVAGREDIEMDIVYSTGTTRHFRGSLTPLGKLTGTWYETPAGDPVSVTFTSFVQDPP